MSPALNPAFDAGDPSRTSANFTPFVPSPKSGIDPKYGPYPPPEEELIGPALSPCDGATRWNCGRVGDSRRLSAASATTCSTFTAPGASILSHVSLGL